MAFFVSCFECKELASLYEVRIPNNKQKLCPKRGHSYDPSYLSYSFYSWECLMKFVKRHDSLRNTNS